MDSNAAVILVMFAVFSAIALKISDSLLMLLIITRLVSAVYGMHYVSFLLLSLISRTAFLFGFGLSRLTESETLLLRNRMKQTFCHRFRHRGE